MSETQLHLLELLRILNSADQALHLESDAPHQLIGGLSSFAGDAKLLLNVFSQLFLGNE